MTPRDGQVLPEAEWVYQRLKAFTGKSCISPNFKLKSLFVNSKEIKQVFNRFNGMNIVIIGDVMVDSYMWGRVDRISPEAPIPIVSANKREDRPGGAANVALNVQALGANPILCSVTGDDTHRQLFLELMEEKRLDSSGILADSNRRTTVKTRIISGNQQLIRVDEEVNDKIDRPTEKKLIELIRRLLCSEKIDAVIFEDYDKGVITPSLIGEVRDITADRGILLTADPKKRNFGHYKNLDLFTPNLKELSEGLRMDIERTDLEGIEGGARKLQEANNIRYLLVTLSERGIYLRHDGEGTVVPTEVRDVADVSGAGDTVIAVATACLAAGCSARNMTMVANLAGGQVIEKVGVIPVNKEHLLQETLALFARRSHANL